jgi:hypothetical protein
MYELCGSTLGSVVLWGDSSHCEVLHYRDAMPSRWAVTRPEHVVAWLDRQQSWWFAGGWAIELFLDASIREHSDLEIGCFRDSANQLIAQLTSALGPLEVVAAKHKVVTPVTDVAAVPDDHQALWLRRDGEPLWLLEVLLEQRVAGRWQFRRGPRISRGATASCDGPRAACRSWPPRSSCSTRRRSRGPRTSTWAVVRRSPIRVRMVPR